MKSMFFQNVDVKVSFQDRQTRTKMVRSWDERKDSTVSRISGRRSGKLIEVRVVFFGGRGGRGYGRLLEDRSQEETRVE
jgi:hypothetical protein